LFTETNKLLTSELQNPKQGADGQICLQLIYRDIESDEENSALRLI